MRRFGLGKIVFSWPFLLSLVIAAVAAAAIPAGRSDLLLTLLQVHAGLAGFSLTVFGFVILGGKDDFFEPLIRQRQDGLDLLRDMVLILFWPLAFHFVSFALCLMRLLLPQIGTDCVLSYGWRWCYGWATTYSVLLSFLSARYLFRLAIIRLIWRSKEIRRGKSSETG